jgi:HK97 family phage portal protein
MGLIESISRGALGLRADVSGTPAPWDDYWYNPLGSASASGMRITEDTAKRVATVLACVSVKSKDVGMMPCKLYTEAPDGSKRLVDHHPVYDILYSRPNDQQTAFEFKQQMQGHVELRGNAYAEIKPGKRGAVDQLIPMHPDRVHVERIKPSGRLLYKYNDPLTNNTRTLVQEEVFHLRNFCDDSAVGQSTIGMACDTFGIALAQQDYSARFLKNDARPPFVFEGTNFKTKADREQFIAMWQEQQTGGNRGKTGILPIGVSIKELGVKPIDQQLLDARKFSRIEICSIFGVPPHLIGETEKTATYASVEQFNIMYAVHCILPILIMWEQAIQRDLLTSSKYFAKFSLAALLRGDTASRYSAYHIAIGDGWLCQDEVRALEDMNPIPGGIGRRYWRPVNWAPLDQTAVPASVPEDTADTTSDDPNAGDGGTDTGEDTGAKVDPKTVRLQLEALAASVADRCVRKEVAALRKMVERGADDYAVEEFYAEHTEFIGQAFNLDPQKIVPVRQNTFDRAGEVCRLLGAGDRGAAFDYIDRLAATEPIKLANLVVGGSK